KHVVPVFLFRAAAAAAATTSLGRSYTLPRRLCRSIPPIPRDGKAIPHVQSFYKETPRRRLRLGEGSRSSPFSLYRRHARQRRIRRWFRTFHLCNRGPFRRVLPFPASRIRRHAKKFSVPLGCALEI